MKVPRAGQGTGHTLRGNDSRSWAFMHQTPYKHLKYLRWFNIILVTP